MKFHFEKETPLLLCIYFIFFTGDLYFSHCDKNLNITVFKDEAEK